MKISKCAYGIVNVCLLWGCSGRELGDENVGVSSSAVVGSTGRHVLINGASTGDSQFSHEQSESAMGISSLGNNQAMAVVAYNDHDFGSHETYTATTRKITSGDAVIGISYMQFDQTQPITSIGPNNLTGGPWNYAPKVSPPTGWAALWGDPSLAVSQHDSNYVFVSVLAMPSSKFPTGGITGDVEDYLGGACILRSQDHGQTFAVAQCVSTANQDFYDGSTLVTTQSGAVFVSFINMTTGRIDVWTSPSETGTFTQLPDPFSNISGPMNLHPRLRTAPNGNVVYIAALEGVAPPTTCPLPPCAPLPPPDNLWMNSFAAGSWGTAVKIVSGVNPLPIITRPANPPYAVEIVRQAGSFSFDVGRSSGANDGIRIAATVYDPNREINHIQTFACSTTLAGCGATPEWNTSTTGDSEEWSPLVKTTVSSGTTGNPTWVMTFKQRTPLNGVASFGSDGYFLNVESNGTRDKVTAGQGDGKPWSFKQPCPSVDQGDENLEGGTYWGDYDDLVVASESWNPDSTGVHPYFFSTETESGGTFAGYPTCTSQWKFVAAPMHIGMNMFFHP